MGRARRFTNVVAVGWISGVGAVILILLAVFMPEWREVLSFSLTALLAAGGITSAYYVGAGFRHSAAQTTLNRTFDYMRRWGDAALIPAREAVAEWVERVRDDEEAQKRFSDEIDNDKDLNRSAVELMNFLEELALAIRRGVVDRDLEERFFKPLVLDFWMALNAWTKNKRRKRGDQLYVELQWLYEQWNVQEAAEHQVGH